MLHGLLVFSLVLLLNYVLSLGGHHVIQNVFCLSYVLGFMVWQLNQLACADVENPNRSISSVAALVF